MQCSAQWSLREQSNWLSDKETGRMLRKCEFIVKDKTRYLSSVIPFDLIIRKPIFLRFSCASITSRTKFIDICATAISCIILECLRLCTVCVGTRYKHYVSCNRVIMQSRNNFHSVRANRRFSSVGVKLQKHIRQIRCNRVL